MLNKQFFSGRLREDPELRHTKTGKSVCNVYLAVDYFIIEDPNDGESKKKTVWPKLVFWGKTAEVLTRYRKKGEIITVETHMEADEWYDPVTKRDVKSLMLVVDRLHLEDNRGGGKRKQKEETPDVTFSDLGDDDSGLPF